LKAIQKLFADIPQRAALDIDGFDAVRLWQMHKQGLPGALDALLTYNAEDTIVLAALLVKAFNKETEKHKIFEIPMLEDHKIPKLFTQVSPAIYRRLRGH
jgi:uncharacterized protein YprB with RNaseH-like and TPR domain